MIKFAGAGASLGAGKTTISEWTCSGANYLAIDLRVGREPMGDGVRRDSPKPVKFQLRGRGRVSSRTFWGVT